MGKNNWHISDFMTCIKKEVHARENCDFIKDKNDYEHLSNTTHSLLGVQKHLRKNCVLCGILCQNVIDVSIRKKILRNEKRCFRRLMTGHILKNAERATNITTAKEKFTTLRFVKTLLPSTIKNIVKVKNLLLTITQKKKIKLLKGAKTDALLQTADCLISNP